MKTALFFLACCAAYGLILLLFRGGHSHGKSSEMLDAETDAQLDALRRRGL